MTHTTEPTPPLFGFTEEEIREEVARQRFEAMMYEPTDADESIYAEVEW